MTSKTSEIFMNSLECVENLKLIEVSRRRYKIKNYIYIHNTEILQAKMHYLHVLKFLSDNY